MHKLQGDVQTILYHKSEIAERVAEMGKQISADYAGKEIHAVCTLRGAVTFYADLVRAIDQPVIFDFMVVSSYGAGVNTSGAVRILKDLEENIEGKDVLIVEDILDTGTTLSYLKEYLSARKPASIRICTLLDKPERRKANISADYIGFVIPDAFVVGYGLDYNQRYRNMPDIGILDPCVYNK